MNNRASKRVPLCVGSHLTKKTVFAPFLCHRSYRRHCHPTNTFRLGKRYPWIRTFVDDRLPLYERHVEWRETGGNPRLIVFDEDMGIKHMVQFRDEHKDVEAIVRVSQRERLAPPLPPVLPPPHTHTPLLPLRCS